MTSRKRSPVGYVLDVADLVVLPRLLVGVKQRAEGTLPGMPGTHTGDPFPMARLPVQPGTAALRLAVLGALVAGGRALGLGAWGTRRRHPRVTVGIAFAAGAAYALTTDSPPIGFVSHTWALAVPLGLAAGVLLRRYVVPGRSHAPRRFPARAAVALAEAGTFVVLPATVVWQAATAQGWTTSWVAHAGVGTVAALVATAVAASAWRGRQRSIVVAALLAAGYVATGSALVPFLGSLALEVARARATSVVPVSVSDRLASVS